VQPHPQILSGGWMPTRCTSQSVLRRGAHIEEGGSLTILATALVDTGSRMTKSFLKSSKHGQHGGAFGPRAG